MGDWGRPDLPEPPPAVAQADLLRPAVRPAWSTSKWQDRRRGHKERGQEAGPVPSASPAPWPRTAASRELINRQGEHLGMRPCGARGFICPLLRSTCYGAVTLGWVKQLVLEGELSDG